MSSYTTLEHIARVEPCALGVGVQDVTEHGSPLFTAGGETGTYGPALHHGEAVILSSIGARCGRCFYASGDWTAGANTVVIYPGAKSDPRFLFQYLEGVRPWPIQGSGQPYIGATNAKTAIVPDLPLSEQRRIATVLDTWDEAVDTSLRLADTLKLRHEHLAEHVWQDGPADYSCDLGDFCRPRQWPTPGKNGMIGGDIPVYGANGVIGAIDRPTHTVDTIAIGCRGSVGEVHLVPAPAYITGNAMTLDELDACRVNLNFLYHQLRFTGFSEIVSGSSQPQITQRDMRSKLIWVPSLEGQQRIAVLLDGSDLERKLTIEFATLLRKQKRGLMQKLFTGEWRVPTTGDDFLPGGPAADRLEAAE